MSRSLKLRRREAFFLILLGSVIIPTLPRQVELLRLARRMRPLPMHARREALLGDFYRGIEQLQSRLPLSEPVAVVGAVPGTADPHFVNYYLYPHPTRYYRDRVDYAIRDPKRRPKLIIRAGAGAPQLVTYAQLRDFELQKSTVVGNIQLPAGRRTEFFIPMVSSIDGPGRDSYTVEGALASDEEAHVTLTLEPDGVVRRFSITGTRSFYDLLYQCFGRLEFVAWVKVSSDRPIRAAFWLVNRGAKTAAPIHLAEDPIAKPVRFPVDPKAFLWLLNTGDDYTVAHAGPNAALVPPRGLIGVHATGTVTGRVYAFLTVKEPDGGTRFTWPEDVK